MTRVVRFHEYGGPEVLRIEELEVGEPAAGELRVRIEAIGLNRAEAGFRSGRYIEKAKLPARLGYEAAGVVEALGSGVSGIEVGEAVCVIPGFSMNSYGVYAERAIVPAAAVVRRPAGLTTVEAAAVWMPYLTAYGALIDAVGVGKAEVVVITAASSSVGLAAIQIANSIGAVPIAVTRTRAKRGALLAAGAAHVVVSTDQDTADEVMRLTEGRGARMAFDPVGGPGVVALASALAPRGTLVLYGNLSGEGDKTPFPFGLAVGRGLSLRGYLVFEIIHDPARLARAESFIREGLQTGALKPTVDRTFPLDDIVAAHRYLEGNQQLGKVVVTV
ncbi:zinc-dependent alcohol dehydrogenase family protein [Aromatoleum toluclasticum]|uniref:zinc-dependent alcohol dehydrogenase family protein n=1 Tax=Aromatoleum toluclasticum TaxID=92003 RepID=UPI001D190E72|nr:zinc-dependent alcohol dehydrogenase family protein [Aromatoleum toluclasticum]MCC4116683.1 zinc-dependent alcohol dehydrogenase family protein [Aromatoleum toluclasticum]